MQILGCGNLKKLINGRWFPLAVAIAIVTVVALVMALFGWRITYAPTLENSWDAVSAVASWVGVIASFVAIMIAIWIPKKIAKQQDKIALFEKRMECYSTLQNIFAFAWQISDAKSKKYIQTAFKLYFGGPDSFPKAQSFTWYTIALKQQEPIIVGGHFLFFKYNEEKLQDVLMQILKLSKLVAVNNGEEAEEPISDAANNCKQDICIKCKELEETLIPLMEKELQL